MSDQLAVDSMTQLALILNTLSGKVGARLLKSNSRAACRLLEPRRDAVHNKCHNKCSGDHARELFDVRSLGAQAQGTPARGVSGQLRGAAASVDGLRRPEVRHRRAG